MTLQEMLLGGGGALLVLTTLIQISPLKIDPWGAFARWIGRALNGDVLKKLDTLEHSQQETKERLDEHIHIDDERDADAHRQRILRFNSELIKGENFTHEYFVDILVDLDEYEEYCEAHPGYKNNRAVMAIANIKRVYAEHEKNNSFVKA